MKRLVLLFIMLVVSAVVCPQVWAQSPPQHQHSSLQVIDGAKNPELIPDNTVYFVALNNLSLPVYAAETEKGFQKASLDRLNLNPVDRENLRVIAQEFRSAHQAWQAKHDVIAEALPSAYTASNRALLLQQREDLISAARDSINRTLSSAGLESLAKYMKYIRSTIKIRTGGTPQ